MKIIDRLEAIRIVADIMFDTPPEMEPGTSNSFTGFWMEGHLHDEDTRAVIHVISYGSTFTDIRVRPKGAEHRLVSTFLYTNELTRKTVAKAAKELRQRVKSTRHLNISSDIPGNYSSGSNYPNNKVLDIEGVLHIIASTTLQEGSYEKPRMVSGSSHGLCVHGVLNGEDTPMTVMVLAEDALMLRVKLRPTDANWERRNVILTLSPAWEGSRGVAKIAQEMLRRMHATQYLLAPRFPEHHR